MTATRSPGAVARPLPGRPPILPRSYVARTRLGTALDRATQDGGITVLVAPAGAGKTLGVAGWLRDRGRRDESVWVPRADTLTVRDLVSLAGMRDEAGQPRLVVVDDAHELPPDAVAWLDEQLDRAPDELDVLLLSRWDLPLTRLVHELLGTLTVLRGGLLRLDHDETALLVADHARNDSPELARLISSRTQGWCAAVVLAAKALADRQDPVAAARELATNPGILDRVASEAFAALNPDQRHVLLCVAAERVVPATEAVRLTGDPDAGHILEELESTGLHVTRYDDPLAWLRPRLTRAGALRTENQSTDEPTFVVHPLLRELSRRRLVAGGPEADRASAAVGRAVRQDLDRGELGEALHRLITVGDVDAVADTLALHGPAIVLSGHSREVATLPTRHPDLVERRPDCWFTLAVERWESGDVGRARDWLGRIDRVPDAASASVRPDTTARLDGACALALLAVLGDAPLARAVDQGVAVLESAHAGGQDWARTSLLRLLVGTAQVRLGDLDAGERRLAEVADTEGLATRSSALVARATSQLALTQLLRGYDHTASRLRLPDGDQHGRACAAGLDIAHALASLHMLDPTDGSTETPSGARGTAAEHTEGDPVAHVLLQVLRSRRLLLEGRAAEAQRVLQTGVATVTMPTPLRGTVLVEEALQASLTGDRDVLRHVAEQLRELGLHGEAALAEGFRADLSDDLTKAADLFATAVTEATLRQPPTAALASVSRAQVLDALGRRSEAREALLQAVTGSEVRRSLVPFLGWSRHGRPIADLLRELAVEHPSAWSQELSAAVARRTALVSLAGIMTATPQEQAHVPSGATYVSLSPRERDVLHELARGSTYADIAANLYLSENTVKTHVSSVYAKLAVNRRSDALAVARTLHLL